MPFGKYLGWDTREIPLDYLAWLARRPSLSSLYGPLRRAVERELTEDRQDSDEVGLLLPVDSADKKLVLDLIENGYRALALKHHPDRGGDIRTM